MSGHNAAIYALCEGWKENTVISGSGDKYVVQWDVLNGRQDKFSALLPSPVIALLYISDFQLLWIGTANGHIHVIDVKNKKEVHDFNFHSGYIYDLKYDAAFQRVYSVGADGCMNIYNVNDLRHIYRLKLSTAKIRSLYLFEDKILLAEGTGKTIILNTSDGSVAGQFQSHQLACNCHLVSDNNSILFSGGRDAHINMWDLKNSFQLIKSVPAHHYAVYHLIDVLGSPLMASASRDKTIKLWNKRTLTPVVRLNKENYDAHLYSVNALVWQKDSGRLISAGDDKQILVWKIEFAS